MVLHSLAIIFLAVASCLIELSTFASEEKASEFGGYEWLVQIPDGVEVARELADDYDLQLVKQYHNSLGPDIYLFRQTNLGNALRVRRTADPAGADGFFPGDPRVKWAERQVAKVRQKRDFVSQKIPLQSKRWLDSRIRTSLKVDSPLSPTILLKPWDDGKLPTIDLNPNKAVLASPDVGEPPGPFDDPMWNNQWYLRVNQVPSDPSQLKFHTAFRSSRDIDGNETLPVPAFELDSMPKMVSLNVVPVWEAGYTGRGVVVTILDDGVETNHTDLVQNYDPEASTDINGEDRDPTPRYDSPEETHHGTRCAGEVAMQANNNFCGVGIAFNAKIGGIRMLDGSVTDRVEAEAFSFNNHYIDIYSSSWGPSDDGKSVEGPGLMASRALEKGITQGRNGKGVIYVWASGNGGIVADSCAYDGYASNIYTISIGSATEHGNFPIYGEICPSTMAVTYSSGSLTEGKIVSSDILNGCTAEHTGTSASAPLAAGMIALMLESNPNVTWRDVKHIIAWSADPLPLLSNPGWSRNGVGLLVSPAFGFGLLNAAKLVKTAKSWLTHVQGPSFTITHIVRFLTKDRPLEVQVRTQACQGTPNEVRHLEQTELIVSLSHVQRGALRISLISPAGTKTLIAPPRYMDHSSDGLNSWPFISVHNWGEDPAGTWTVIFESHVNVTEPDFSTVGSLHSLRLVLHGSKEPVPSLSVVQKEKTDYTEILRLSKSFTR